MHWLRRSLRRVCDPQMRKRHGIFAGACLATEARTRQMVMSRHRLGVGGNDRGGVAAYTLATVHRNFAQRCKINSFGGRFTIAQVSFAPGPNEQRLQLA